MAKCSVLDTITVISCVDIDTVEFFCWHSTIRYAEWKNTSEILIVVWYGSVWKNIHFFALTRWQQCDGQ